MLNVLYISHESKSVLGSSRSLLNMIQSLNGKVNAIVVVPSKGAAYDFFYSHNINVIDINFPLDISNKHGFKKLLLFLPRLCRDLIAYNKAIKNICNAISKYNIDIIHSNSSTIDIGYYVAKKSGKPHVWHIREFQNLDFNFNPAYGWSYLLNLIRESNATICITKAIQKHFHLENKDNSYQIFNAVLSKNDICYIPQKSKYFLVCGNLSKAKGCELAIRAFSIFNKKNNNYRLKFVGGISNIYKKELQILARNCDVDKLIDFEGYQTDTKQYYIRASAFLMCSRNEAMGRVTIEAMFYGCPVIAYNSGGSKELVKNGIDGFLFSSEKGCANIMENIIYDKNIDKIIYSAQQKAINSFSEENYGNKIYTIYKKVLSK